MSTTPSLPADVFIEVLCAAHLSSHVNGDFPDRGGVMVVGAPGVLKSTFLNVLDTYSDTVKLSDLNMQTLIDMRDQLSNATVRTLVMPEFAKIYERDPRTASNVEGTIRALVAEGFAGASFQNQEMNRFIARATVVAALTPALQESKFKGWQASGFNRRFLWPLIRLKDIKILDRAVDRWRALSLRHRSRFIPEIEGDIPNTTTMQERKELRMMLKSQPGGGVHSAQYSMLVKILAVLKWHYRRVHSRGKAIDTVRQFAPCLAKTGAEITVKE